MTERKIILIDAEGAEALDGSVEKWNRIVQAFEAVKGTDQYPEYSEGGPDDCPLCVRYHPVKKGAKVWVCAKACPIKKDTGRDFCEDTPYDDWSNQREEYMDDADCQTLANAKAFRDYLVDLRNRTVLDRMKSAPPRPDAHNQPIINTGR